MQRSALSPGSNSEIRTPPRRFSAVLFLALVSAAMICLFCAGVSSSAKGNEEIVHPHPALQTPEARRLARILISVQQPSDGNSPSSTEQAGAAAGERVQEQSAALLTVLGEKHLRCETALTQCRADLERASQGCTESSIAEDATKKDQFIAKLLRENKKLKQQLQFLRVATSDGPKAREPLATVEGGANEPTLEDDNLSLAVKLAGADKASEGSESPASASSQLAIDPKIPGLTNAYEKQVLESARKVLEECGAKQAVPQTRPGDKSYACEATEEDLKQYFDYTPRAQCPDDWYFVQTLVYVKNCFCLPKRRCFAPSPSNYREPSTPFPQSLFDSNVLSNDNVRWQKMYWPSYEAVNSRVLGDCRDCFNLTLEATRWEVNFMGTIPIEEMLSLKGKGAIKIGLDAGGGTGSFAAKMAQHGVTIVTTAMNTETLASDRQGGLPYMETIAQRGLVPLFLPHKVRQPFFDGTLDIVHNINSIKYFTIPEFEELLFEWDRILRPGGVMWFELFYAPVSEMPLYISVIEMFGYKKLYWNMTPKVDAAERNDLPHVYLNCVLEKPRRPENAPPVKPVAVSR